jgi:hypothetical protein
MSGAGDGQVEAATGSDDSFGHGTLLVQMPALRQAEAEAYIHAGIAPATKCVCCADLDRFKGMVVMLFRPIRARNVSERREACLHGSARKVAVRAEASFRCERELRFAALNVGRDAIVERLAVRDSINDVLVDQRGCRQPARTRSPYK